MAVDLAGTEILGYRLERCLGEGGMGSVWFARHTSIGKSVAVKVLDPMLSRDATLVQRFRNEAEIQFRLRHPNIAGVENFSDSPLAIVMEYVEGQSLQEMIGKTSGPIPFARAFPLMRQIVDAVDHAHRAGIVHRDIKPSNILVAGDGTVKVMDFGIAKMLGGAKLTQTGTATGTAAYMSPEQIRGAADIDHRTDVYSLGVTFYEMLSGRTPFESGADTESDFAVRLAHVQQEPPDPRQFYPHIPESAAQAVLKAMAKTPEGRQRSAGALLAEIQGAAVPVGPGQQLPAPAPTMRNVADERPVRTRSSKLVPVFAGLAVLLVASVVIALASGGGENVAVAESPAAAPADDGALARQSEALAREQARVEQERSQMEEERRRLASERERLATEEQRRREAAQAQPAGPAPGDEAAAAYKAVLNAYGSGSEDAYFGGYTDPLECWYSKRGVPKSFLRDKRSGNFRRSGAQRSRFEVRDISVVYASSDRVLLRERSVLHSASKSTAIDRGILMRREGGAWRVAGEASAENHGCLPGVY